MSDETKSTNVRTKYYIHCAIMFVLAFVIASLPPFAGITPLGMQVLGIFAAAVYGWCMLGLLWPSLLIMILLGCTEYCTVKESFMTGFGNDVVITVFFMFIFAAYLEESGLSQYIANWFISRKIGEGRPWIFTLLLFSAAFVLAAFVSTFATIIIMWTIFYKVCDAVGEEKKSSYTTMGICGLAIASVLPGMMFTFKPFTQIFYGMTVKSTGMTELVMPFIPWLIYNLVMSAILVGAFMLGAKFILRPDVSKVAAAGEKLAYLRGQKMDTKQRNAMIVLVLFIASQVIPSFLPKTMPLKLLLDNIGILGCAVIALIALMILRSKEGKPIAEVGALVNKGVSWDIIIMLAATMPLCNALESEETGIITSVITWMTATLSDASATMFLILVVILFMLVTQVAHNLVLMLVFIPLLAKMGLNYGINPLVLINIIWFAAQSAFLLPASSSPSAMVYGNSKWVSSKHAYMYNGMYVILAMILMSVIGVPFAQFMFPGM